MVGVAEAGGSAAAAPEFYAGDFYQPPEFFVQSPDMCPHPQHPQHPHMCLHSDYGGVSMGVVGGGSVPPLLLPPVLDDNMRHYMMAPPPPHHPQHRPQHHQATHHYTGANGTSGPQYYSGGFPPPYHPHVPPHHLQPSPPPPTYHKDERSQRQHSKLKRRLEYRTRTNGTAEARSGGSTPSLSPRKEGVNGNGSGAWSEGESSASASLHGDDDDTQNLLDALAADRTPQVSEITPTSALVTWAGPTEPAPPPDMELTYELLLGDRDIYKAIYRGPSISCRVRDLRPGTEYNLRLQIRTSCHPELASRASNVARFRAPPAPPAAPPQPRVTQRSRTTLLLRWGSAAENGARVLHYVVEMDSGGGWRETAQPKTKQFTASHLHMQTEYRFRVAAVNEVGRGEWSDPVLERTVGAPPPAPEPPALVAATHHSLRLRWRRRTEDEEFTLQMDDRSAGHGFLPMYSGRDLEYSCERLRRATDYHFRLRCETADGNGPWSGEVTFRTAPERPGPPGRPAVKGKVHSRAFRLRWEPPSDAGGAEVKLYTLELDGGDGFCAAYSGGEREAVCDRLRPGAAYVARVCCATDAGTSDWSLTETVTTEATCPSACAVPARAGKPHATSAAVCWQPPDADGGAPITEYRLHILHADGETTTVYTGLELETTVRDLTPGTDYVFQVTAANRAGAGPASPPLALSTAPAPPDAPDPPTVVVEAPTRVTVQWTAPNDNGAPLVEYRLEMCAAEAEGYSEVYRGTSTHHTVEGLSPASGYVWRVCAANASGRGAWSRVVAALTPPAVPAAPAALRYKATDTALALSWRAPHHHGAHILRYSVQVGESTSDTCGVECSYTATALAPDTTYRVRVAAVNALGAGAWSEPLEARTRPPPPPPPRLECALTAHNFVKLQWGEGVAPETLQYCLEMRAPESRDFRPAYRGPARHCKVKKLRENTEYWFRIRAACETAGRGEVSAAICVRTRPAPPPAPRAPLVEAAGTRSALVTWEPLADADAGVSYVLQATRDGAVWRDAYVGSDNSTALETEPGLEYGVRVCGVRDGLAGAWSCVTRHTAPPPPPAPRAARRTRAPGATFLERHAVCVYMAGFLALAVGMALLVEWAVRARRDDP